MKSGGHYNRSHLLVVNWWALLQIKLISVDVKWWALIQIKPIRCKLVAISTDQTF